MTAVPRPTDAEGSAVRLGLRENWRQFSLLVLINASVRDAEQVAQRLRRQTQMMIIDPRQPTFAVTASVGIAAYRPRELVEQLLARADTAMYAAKTQGRNRVVIAPGIEISDIPNLVGR